MFNLKNLNFYLTKFKSFFAYEHLNKSRFIWVDYLRGIAVILVVYRHVLIGLRRSGILIPEYLITFNMVFHSFRMPLFFILSGLFINKQITKYSFGEIVRSKFYQLIYPYFIWASLQIAIQILSSEYTNSSRGIFDFLYLFYNPRAIDQFWFLPAFFNATLFYVFTQKKLQLPVIYNLILSIILYYLSYQFNGISLLTDWMSFYLFFVLGDVISSWLLTLNKINLRHLAIKIFFITPLFLASQYYYLFYDIGKWEYIIISLVGCYFIYLIAVGLSELSLIEMLPAIGYYSLYVYCMHVIISAGIRIIMVKIFHIKSTEILLVLGISLSILFSIIGYNLAIRNKYMRLLFYPGIK